MNDIIEHIFVRIPLTILSIVLGAAFSAWALVVVLDTFVGRA